MNIKVLAICYNSEKILPYFLAHYSYFADQIILFDNQSSDRSPEIIKAHPKATLISYSTKGKLEDKAYVVIKNHGWKKFAKNTDWFIVVDIDEFIYHPYPRLLLYLYKVAVVTVPRVAGYNWLTQIFRLKPTNH
jgi:glycosyltransferase involved in cell wall biosynthesis